MKTKKTKKAKKINYSKYKTTEGYIRAVANEMRDIIIQHYREFKPVIKEMRTPHPAYERTDDEIIKLFIKQVKASYNELRRFGKLKKSELPKKASKKIWASAAGAKRAIQSALMSGGFANVDLIYGQNVLKTLREAGLGRLFRDEVARALHALNGGKFKYVAADPLGFRPAPGSKGKSQTVIYSKDGADLIEIDLTWSPAAATIRNLITGRSTTQLIEADKPENTKDAD